MIMQDLIGETKCIYLDTFCPWGRRNDDDDGNYDVNYNKEQKLLSIDYTFQRCCVFVYRFFKFNHENNSTNC